MNLYKHKKPNGMTNGIKFKPVQQYSASNFIQIIVKLIRG